MKHLKRFNEDINLDPDKELAEEISNTCDEILYDITDEGIECDVKVIKQERGVEVPPEVSRILNRVSGNISVGSRTNNEHVWKLTNITIKIGNWKVDGKVTRVDLYSVSKIVDRLSAYLISEGIELRWSWYFQKNPYKQTALNHLLNSTSINSTSYDRQELRKSDEELKQTILNGWVELEYIKKDTNQ
jgi:hypothetical protein